MLARNCAAWLEVELAAAKLGAIVAAQNWRLAPPELEHCLRLAEPRGAAGRRRAMPRPRPASRSRCRCTITLGEEYERRLARAAAAEPPEVAEPEDGLVILYTSGTTGLPKGALISHRAFIARALVFMLELGLAPGEAFVAWGPFFHMVSTDHALASLLRGNPVIVVDGYDPEALAAIVARERIGWLPLVPGMIESFADVLRARQVRPRGIRAIGAMADLVPRHQLAEITTLLELALRQHLWRDRNRAAAGDGVRHPDRQGADRSRQTAKLVLRGPPGRSRRQRGPGRRARRVRGARADAVQRLLAGARGQRQGLPRRLVPHGRHVHPARRWPARFRRPRQVHDQVRRRERLSRRDRARAARRPAGRRRRGGAPGPIRAGARCRSR